MRTGGRTTGVLHRTGRGGIDAGGGWGDLMAVSDGWPVVVAKFWMNLVGFHRGMVVFCYELRSFGSAVRRYESGWDRARSTIG